MKIINPVNNNEYDIFSKNGTQLIKNYLKKYLFGSNLQTQKIIVHDKINCENKYPYYFQKDDLCCKTPEKKFCQYSNFSSESLKNVPIYLDRTEKEEDLKRQKLALKQEFSKQQIRKLKKEKEIEKKNKLQMYDKFIHEVQMKRQAKKKRSKRLEEERRNQARIVNKARKLKEQIRKKHLAFYKKSSKVPAEAPKAPAEAPKALVETPKAPAEAPKAPAEAPMEAPVEAPKAPAAPKAPMEAPAEAPKAPAETEAPKAPMETPAETPKAPAETPKAPAEAPMEAPAEAPMEAPAEAPKDVPTGTPAYLQREISMEEPRLGEKSCNNLDYDYVNGFLERGEIEILDKLETIKNHSPEIYEKTNILCNVGGNKKIYLGINRNKKELVMWNEARYESSNHKKVLINELAILYNVSNPFILRVKAHNESRRGHIDIITEYVSKGSMYEKIIKHSKLKKHFEIYRIKKWIKQLLITLKVLHESKEFHPIVHRDLKPGNIVIDKNDNIKLLDFGISTKFQPYIDGSRSPKPVFRNFQNYVGTIAYMAPEVHSGKGSHFISIDIYTVGLITLSLLTLHSSFWDHVSGMMYFGLRVRFENETLAEKNPDIKLKREFVKYEASYLFLKKQNDKNKNYIIRKLSENYEDLNRESEDFVRKSLIRTNHEEFFMRFLKSTLVDRKSASWLLDNYFR